MCEDTDTSLNVPVKVRVDDHVIRTFVNVDRDEHFFVLTLRLPASDVVSTKIDALFDGDVDISFTEENK